MTEDKEMYSSEMKAEKNQANRQIGLYILIIAVVLIIMILSLVLGVVIGKLTSRKPEPQFSASAIQQKISMCSELTTAELDYHGEVQFEEGSIDWIDKKTFTMEYDAHVEAGIDLSKATVTVEDNIIYVTLPEPEVQDVIIDANSLQFKDETFSLFNWIQHEDTAEAISYAEQDADSHVEESKLIESAKEQAEYVITTLLQPIVEDEDSSYEIVIR